MKSIYTLLIVSLVFGLGSCKKEDPLVSPDYKVIQKVKDAEILLRNNLWGYHDLVVDVQNEMRAIPLLANVADANGMVQPGKYNSYAIYGNSYRQENYSYQFGLAKAYRDTTNSDAYYKVGFYNVLNAKDIRLNPDSLSSATYNYRFIEDDDLLVMTSDHLTNGVINEFTNKLITDAIISGKPNELANAMVDEILGNPNVQSAIQELLYDMVYGKVEALTQSASKISEVLANVFLHELKEVDWETLVYNKLVDLLEELKVNNPQLVAQTLATQIAERIETTISQADIYNAILPVLQNFENETLPVLVPNLSQAIYSVMVAVFSEENIYDKIYPVWIGFAQVDSSEIAVVADTLGTVLTQHFFDTASLATQLEPFITTLRTTSTFQIPALAQSIINNSLKPAVDSLNATFPGMDINPDWDNVKTLLSSALTVLKSSLSGKTDAQAAAELAQGVIGIMNTKIVNGIDNAIHELQDIPAAQASQIIAAWVANMVIVAQPQIITYLEDKLNALADLFNAEEIASKIADQIKRKLLDTFSETNIYNLILPVIEELSDLDVEAVAAKMADWLTDLGIVKNNVTEEQLLAALTDIINDLIGEINVDNATQKLLDAILQSDIVNSIDGAVLKQVLEFKIYEFLIEIEQQINAINRIEFSLERR